MRIISQYQYPNGPVFLILTRVLHKNLNLLLFYFTFNQYLILHVFEKANKTFEQERILLVGARAGLEERGVETWRPGEKCWGLKQAVRLGWTGLQGAGQSKSNEDHPDEISGHCGLMQIELRQVQVNHLHCGFGQN